MTSAEIRNDIKTHLRRWRLRLALQRLLLTASAVSVLVAIALLLDAPMTSQLLAITVLVLVFFAHLIYSRHWRQSNQQNFLQHLNRRLPAFEESAQLLIQDDDSLTAMQRLQRQRACSIYQQNLARVEQWQAPIHYRPAIIVILICGLIAVLSGPLRQWSANWLKDKVSLSSTVQNQDRTSRVEQILISIEPPQYTGLKTFTSSQADLEIVEGSKVHWDLVFSAIADKFAIELSDGTRIALEPDSKNHWHATTTINKTDLYWIVARTAENEVSVGDIYSLRVSLDQAPDVRVIKPETTTLEIKKNGPASFRSSVLIRDDYAVQTVEIIASVAKGSGEGVKFRDQKLVIEQTTETDRGMLYERQWQLPDLGMEPGDEVYFSVVATDNKQPKANTGRSATVIVRWLEDETGGLETEGLAIDYIPEFFKSQRQIIIDTEQLLEDMNKLEAQQFNDTSYEIGHAQSDLKQKYGQYLGDEFGEVPGEQLGIMDEIAASHSDEPGAGQDEDGHARDGHTDGDHAVVEGGISNKDISTTADIVRLFGHDHGDPEIGPITKRNPVGLMKRAVNEMWQAEKHLMQAEPGLALPFEHEAYKYLKLARQADRIYVKRLGFEPPPVSEDRRLSGELDEVLSYQVTEDPVKLDEHGQRAIQRLLRQAYQLLSSQASYEQITPSQSELLARMGDHLMLLSQQRPALIQQAASIKKLMAAGKFALTDCDNCVNELKQSLWNLMDEGDARLRQRGSVFYNQDELIKAYRQALPSTMMSDDPAGELP